MKKKIKAFLQANVIPIILASIARFIFFTARKTYHFPKNYKGETFVYAFWHGNSFLQPLAYKKFKKNGQIKSIISEHRDGVMIKNFAKLLGVGDIKGSSTRGGVKALLNSIKELKSGVDISITPDGPKGPRHSVADGIVKMAQKTSSPIVFAAYVPQSYWRAEKAWDKYMIPKPFSKIDFYISEPVYINGLNDEEAKALIKEKLMLNEII